MKINENKKSRKPSKFVSKDFLKVVLKIAPKANFVSKAHLQNENAVLLGHCLDRFQRLELTLRSMIDHFFSPHDQEIVYILTNRLSFSDLVNALMAINRERNSNDETLIIILKEALRAEEMRNTLFHSFWTDGEEGLTRFKSTIKKGKFIEHQVAHSTAELVDIVEWIHAINLTLTSYWYLLRNDQLGSLDQTDSKIVI